MEATQSIGDFSLTLTDSFRSDTPGLETKVLSRHLSHNSLEPHSQKLLDICRAVHELNLVDPAQVMAEGRSSEEVQPFIRALGVTAEDLWSHYCSSKPTLQQAIQEAQSDVLSGLEESISAEHMKLCQLLGTKDPVKAVGQLQVAIARHNQDKVRLKVKKASLMEAISKASHACSDQFDEIIGVLSSNSENHPVSADDVTLQNLRLKLDLTYQEIWQGLYNERTLPALEEIYAELVQTLDEQLDLRAQLRGKLQKYEANPRLKEVFAEYSKVKRQIEAKRRDIAALGS